MTSNSHFAGNAGIPVGNLPCFTGILDLLQQNQDEWTYEGGELSFANDELAGRYNELYASLGANEARINGLSNLVMK